MHLKVGPFVYRVVFVEGFVEHDGAECLGLCDHERHEITISRSVSEAQQIQVIGHEYMEAWVYHFGADLADDAAQKERWCDLFGAAMTQFVMDLVRTMREAGATDGWTEPEAEAGPPAAATGQAPPTRRAGVSTKPRRTADSPESPARRNVEARLRAEVMAALRRAGDDHGG